MSCLLICTRVVLLVLQSVSYQKLFQLAPRSPLLHLASILLSPQTSFQHVLPSPLRSLPPPLTPCPPGGEEDIQNSLQEKAQLAGGFAAPAAALALEELGVGTPAGWLNRGLLLQVGRDRRMATNARGSCRI